MAFWTWRRLAFARSETVSQRVRESRLYARIYEDVMRDDAAAADLLSLKRARAILDVPCGTGNRARRMARACAEQDNDVTIVAADVSWATLETARQYLRAEGLQDRVHLLRVPATRLPIASATFDRVHCAGALHLAHDIDEALSEFARVLQPGGICVISTVVMGPGLLGRAVRRLAEVPSGFHWFGPDELPGRMAAQGLAVYAEHVVGDALTVAARRV